MGFLAFIVIKIIIIIIIIINIMSFFLSIASSWHPHSSVGNGRHTEM